MTFADAAAPSGRLDALLVVFVSPLLVIAPSLGLLFMLDQRDRLGGYGVGSDAEPPTPGRPAADGENSP